MNKDGSLHFLLPEYFVKSLIAFSFAALASLASPALANSSSSAVDVPAASRASESALSGDQRFHQLFASWEALDPKTTAEGQPRGAIVPTVSIPARMPLDEARLTSGFGMRSHPVLGGRRNHKGIDLAAPTGTPVYATADGIVERADWFSSYGLFVKIDHGASLETRYAHMSRLAVAAGERVKKGDIIGYVGSTGRSTGPHLHYEVRVDGRAVDPVPYMAQTSAQARLAQGATPQGLPAQTAQTQGAQGGE